MTKNIRLNPGSGGETIASDEIAGVQYPKNKIGYGSDGSYIDVQTGVGLPVIMSAPLTDAFGRVRVSNPTSLFDSKLTHDKLTTFWDESITNTSGNATSTHSSENACVTMHVENGDTIIRQTVQRFNYQPGKSQLVFFTGRLGTFGSGTVARIGLFDNNNGLFFEASELTLKVVERKAGSDIAVSQSSWNIDKLDGTGASGHTIDPSKTQILFIDYEWLGVGTVRYGFVLDGVLVYCHSSHHANSVTSVYMSTPNLPIRYEVSTTSETAEMDHICTSVISEGGLQDVGYTRSVSNGISAINVSTTWEAILGIRLKSNYIDSVVKVEEIYMSTGGSASIEWALFKNPTVTGGMSFGDFPNAPIQSGVGSGSSTITNLGEVILGGHITTQGQGFVKNTISTFEWLGSKIDGTQDEWILAARSFSTPEDVSAVINFKVFI